MKIPVAKEHLENGVPEDEGSCPIALATVDAYKSMHPHMIVVAHVSEDHLAIYEWTPGGVTRLIRRYRPNEKLREFIWSFDGQEAETLEPFSFDTDELDEF